MTHTSPDNVLGPTTIRVSGSDSLFAKMRTVTQKRTTASRLVFATDPLGLAAEQYKILRRMLMNSHPEGGAMLVTSPGRGEGKTLTAVNLAWALASGGEDTCVVDLAFRSPALMKTLGVAGADTCPDRVLTNIDDVTKAVCKVADTSLQLLATSGRADPLGRCFSPDLVGPAIQELKTHFKWLVLDCASAIPASDIPNLMPHVDGALLIVRPGMTIKSLIAPCLEIIGPKLWGVVMNDTRILGGEDGINGRP
jgi:Mrp family chromosome partitioning ATPase